MRFYSFVYKFNRFNVAFIIGESSIAYRALPVNWWCS